MIVPAPYMLWAKTRTRAAFDLAGSNLMGCTLDDLPEAREALELSGSNDDGYGPLVEAIARRYHVGTERVALATGTSGANFLVCAALVAPGDEVLVERPGYDPLIAAAATMGATVTRFERRFEEGYALNPDAVRSALTRRTRLIVVTNAHNPSGVVASRDDLAAVGRLAEGVGARVLVDEVYLEATLQRDVQPAGCRSEVFVTTNSLTKAYGLSGLRCGWVLTSADVAGRVRRARDVVDGTGPFPTEKMAAVAFAHLDRLAARARRILEQNHAAARSFLASHPRVECVERAGGPVIFPRLRGVDDAGPFVDRLFAEYQTAVAPGRFFEAPAHFRVALGGRPETVAGGLVRIGTALAAIT